MGMIVTNRQHYADIATAIRAKNGRDRGYKPAEMAGAIAGIVSSGADVREIDTELDKLLFETDTQWLETLSGYSIADKIRFLQACRDDILVSIQNKGTGSYYLFGDVKLPPLPGWDQEKYPYAYISVMGDIAYLAVCDKLGYLKEGSGDLYSYTLGGTGADPDESKLIGHDGWVAALTDESCEAASGLFPGISTTGWLQDIKDEYSYSVAGNTGPIWANTDIAYENGDIAVQAGAPIPVAEAVPFRTIDELIGRIGQGGAALNNQDLTVTENGTYTPPEGYTGFGTVVVNVAGSGGIVNPITWDGQPTDTSISALGNVGYLVSPKVFTFNELMACECEASGADGVQQSFVIEDMIAAMPDALINPVDGIVILLEGVIVSAKAGTYTFSGITLDIPVDGTYFAVMDDSWVSKLTWSEGASGVLYVPTVDDLPASAPNGTIAVITG